MESTEIVITIDGETTNALPDPEYNQSDYSYSTYAQQSDLLTLQSFETSLATLMLALGIVAGLIFSSVMSRRF